ncbi:DUF262 domain-containing protein [Streptomyces sp. NBC_01304]|uniref:DUF262 domain-containing protein n=1 Tax=Streptomyces sp. NBC_01304 TaxID=2903818 RepID=UPI002E13882F|nr:DUF262 domain-containing protein [Streptomyces sp. NBC_01304]
MSRQTSQPLRHVSLRTSDRSPREIASTFRKSLGLDLDPSYQRGHVWTQDDRVELIRSWLTGTPTGVVIFNDRSTPEWKEATGYDPTAIGEAMYACIDGKQRVTTAYLWYDGELAVPASWFPAEDVIVTEDTADGPYVRHPGLSRSRQLKFSNQAHLSIAMAKVATLADEAEIYLRVNGAGAPQSEADMANAANAARVASPSTP